MLNSTQLISAQEARKMVENGLARKEQKEWEEIIQQVNEAIQDDKLYVSIDNFCKSRCYGFKYILKGIFNIDTLKTVGFVIGIWTFFAMFVFSLMTIITLFN